MHEIFKKGKLEHHFAGDVVSAGFFEHAAPAWEVGGAFNEAIEFGERDKAEISYARDVVTAFAEHIFERCILGMAAHEGLVENFIQNFHVVAGRAKATLKVADIFLQFSWAADA